MIKPPLAVSLIFGKRFQAKPGEGFSLQGILSSLSFASFPSPPADLAVFFALTDGAGEGVLSLDFSFLEASSELRTFFRKSRWYHFPADPLMIISGGLITNQLVFPRPGMYPATLRFEAHVVTERRLPVFQT